MQSTCLKKSIAAVKCALSKGDTNHVSTTVRLRTVLISLLVVFSITSSTILPAHARELNADWSNPDFVSVYGQVVPIDWSYFVTGAPGIPQDDRSKAWERALSRTIGYNIMGQWDTWYQDPGDGYYTFESPCEFSVHDPNGGMRQAGRDAFALAVMLKTGIDFPVGIDPSVLRARAYKLIKSIARRHIVNSPNPGDLVRWGYDPNQNPDVCGIPPNRYGLPGNVQGAWWAEMAGSAGWMVWDDPGNGFTSLDKEYIQKMVEYEANRFSNNIPGYRRDKAGNIIWENRGNSLGESEGWDSRILQLATAMMPYHPNWDTWMNKNKELMIAAFSRPMDANGANSGMQVHGKSLFNWLNGSNIEDNGDLANACRLPHPNYMTAIFHTGHAALLYTLARQSIPQAAIYNSNKVYQAFVNDRPGYGPIYMPDQAAINCASSQPIEGCLLFDPYNSDSSGSNLYYDRADALCNPNKYTQFAIADAQADALGYDDLAPPDKKGAYWEYARINYVDGSGLGDDAEKVGPGYLLKWLEHQPYVSNTVNTAGTLRTAVSDMPYPWRDKDLGTVSKAGKANFVNNTYTVVGAGSADNLGLTSDQMHYSYVAWNGDGEINVRMPSWTPGSTMAQAGVMIREDLTRSSRFASVLFQNGQATPYFRYRTVVGQQSGSVTSRTTGTWLKLARYGNLFTAYTSSDGTSWKSIGSQTISMSHRVYIGLAVTSWDTAALTSTAWRK